MTTKLAPPLSIQPNIRITQTKKPASPPAFSLFRSANFLC